MNAVETTPISDPSDPRIEVFQGLRDRALRQRREGATGDMAGVFIAEGDVVIERAVSAGYELVSVLVDAKRSQALSKVMEGHPVYAAGPTVIEQITGQCRRGEHPDEFGCDCSLRGRSRYRCSRPCPERV